MSHFHLRFLDSNLKILIYHEKINKKYMFLNNFLINLRYNFTTNLSFNHYRRYVVR